MSSLLKLATENDMFSQFADMKVHQQQPKLWQGDGMNSLTGAGICQLRLPLLIKIRIFQSQPKLTVEPDFNA